MRYCVNNCFLPQESREFEDIGSKPFYLLGLLISQVPRQQMHLTSILRKVGRNLDPRNKTLQPLEVLGRTQSVMISEGNKIVPSRPQHLIQLSRIR